MSEGEERRRTHAELMRNAVQKRKKETGDKAYERKMLKAYPLISPVYGMSPKQFREHWYSLDTPGKDIADYFTEMFPGYGMGKVRIYRGQVGSISELISPNLVKSPLWKYFVQVWAECKGLPVVVFYVKGVQSPFVLVNDDGKGNITTTVLIPRIRIPAAGLSNDIYIYPMDLFLKENTNE